MKTKLASIFAIVSMLVIVAMSWMPSASAEEGTVTVNEDDCYAWRLAHDSGHSRTLSFTIDVQNDEYIDVVVLDEYNYNQYLYGASFSYLEGSKLNTLYVTDSVTFYAHDNYYLVLDNTNDPPGGAQPAWDGVNNYCTAHYTVTVVYSSDSGSEGASDDSLTTEGVMFGLMVFGIIFTIIIVIVLIAKKRGGRVQPYEPSQPSEPYYRDQQSPPPPDYHPPGDE